MRTPDAILKKLEERREQNAFREFMSIGIKVDFFSNDYLGLAQIPFEKYYPSGSTGSRLISGNTDLTEEVELKLADFFGMESGVFFNSGYDANLGLFSSVPQRGDTILYDELIHASIRDGIRLSLAKAYAFKHNDLGHLLKLINRAEGTIYIATESIFSMDGDQAPLLELADIAEKNNAFLIVDEAHSGGIFGHNGEGLVSELGINDKIFAKLITFGKAFGSHGAIILGNYDLKDYLINFARSLIYTTALPPHSIKRIEFAVETVAGMDDEITLLKKLIGYFKACSKGLPYEIIESNSPIQSIVVPGNEKAKALAEKCLNNGFAVKAILAPTVPLGKERIRVCLHSFNTEEEIDKLIECLN